MLIKKTLAYSRFPCGAGSPAIFHCCKRWKMKEPGNRIFGLRPIFGQDSR